MDTPKSTQAEKAVLGSMLINPEAIYDTDLEPSDFYDYRHQTIFQTFQELYKAGKKIDLVSVSQVLTDRKQIENIGNAYLASLPETVLTANNYKEHSKIVKDKSIRRKLLEAQVINTQIIMDEDKDIESVLAETQSNYLKINKVGEIDDSVKTILREIEEVNKTYQEKYDKGQIYLGYQCGIEDIDKCIDGLRPGHIWVVGAWTSTGKTQFALNIVHNVLEQNIPTSIISLEMSRVDTVARIIGIRHNLSSMSVLKGKNEAMDTRQRIEEAKIFLRQAPLEVHTTYFDIEKIKMLIRRDVHTKGVKFVVIDYVQNIISEKGAKEYDIMTRSATDLQGLARELGITIYLVSQISNESEKGTGAGAGFKGTGALEAVADLAIKLERNRKEENPEAHFVPLKIRIAKNRHGFTGVLDNYYLWLKSGKIEANLAYIPYMK